MTKEVVVLEKVTAAKKAEAKKKLGDRVIAKMDSGVKRSRSEPDDECDHVEESDDCIGVVDDVTHSAAYRLEKKITISSDPEDSLPSKKRGKSSPPKQGSFLSSDQMKERFGTVDISDSGDESVGLKSHSRLDLEEVNHLNHSCPNNYITIVCRKHQRRSPRKGRRDILEAGKRKEELVVSCQNLEQPFWLCLKISVEVLRQVTA